MIADDGDAVEVAALVVGGLGRGGGGAYYYCVPTAALQNCESTTRPANPCQKSRMIDGAPLLTLHFFQHECGR